MRAILLVCPYIIYVKIYVTCKNSPLIHVVYCLFIYSIRLTVPSENKRDARTIEQVLADSRAKRKRLEERTSASETFGHNNEKSNTV